MPFFHSFYLVKSPIASVSIYCLLFPALTLDYLVCSLSFLFSFMIFSPSVSSSKFQREDLIGSGSKTQSHPRPPRRGLKSLKPAAFSQVLVPGSTSCGQGGGEVGTKPRELPVIPFPQKEALGLKATLKPSALLSTNPPNEWMVKGFRTSSFK